jgi:hypothetical protein
LTSQKTWKAATATMASNINTTGKYKRRPFIRYKSSRLKLECPIPLTLINIKPRCINLLPLRAAIVLKEII